MSVDTVQRRPPKLAVIVTDSRISNPPARGVVESTVNEISNDNTNDWDVSFLNQIYTDTVEIQDEQPPEPPVELPGVVILLDQVPTARIEPGETYTGPPVTQDPLRDLVHNLYLEIGSDIEIWVDGIAP